MDTLSNKEDRDNKLNFSVEQTQRLGLGSVSMIRRGRKQDETMK